MSPLGHNRTHAVQQISYSITASSAGEQRKGHSEAERFGVPHSLATQYLRTKGIRTKGINVDRPDRRARLVREDGRTTEWKSKALRAYQRRTATNDAIIASTGDVVLQMRQAVLGCMPLS